MTAVILDGKSISREIQDEVKVEVSEFIRRRNQSPALAAVLVGEDPGSQVYIRNKRRACNRVGIKSHLHQLPDGIDEGSLLGLIQSLNDDHDVHGILVQLPLPRHVDMTRVLDSVNPLKDVDAFHPENVGRLVQGRPRFLPCTPQGIVQILFRSDIRVSGKHVVVIGRSDIVGKPLAMMLAQRQSPLGDSAANATVTICHSRTTDLPEIARSADILVAALGCARFVTEDMIRPGATVIDVGINRTDSGIVGDVDFENIRHLAGFITPVPGGVGPLTVAMLLRNTLLAAQLQFG